MKIMSLNVNQFRSVRILDGSWVKEIIALVKRFLSEDSDNVAFLYEVPGTLYNTDELDKQFRPYEVARAGKRGNIASFVISIQTPKRWRRRQSEPIWGKNYLNKYVELEGEGERVSGLNLLGIHTPCPGKYYSYDNVWEYLVKLQEYAEKLKNQKFIIIGDFNITTNEKRTRDVKKELEEEKKNGEPDEAKIKADEDFLKRQEWLLTTMPSIGYSDAIKGEPITYFGKVNRNRKREWKGTTIDHVLVSSRLKNAVTAYVVPRWLCELSDHAVIIVDVDV